MAQQLASAQQILNKNAAYFAPGGQYDGYINEISNTDIASLGASLSGTGLGVYTEITLKPPYGGAPGPWGSTSYPLDIRMSNYRALGAVATVAGAGLDGYSLGKSIADRDFAAGSLSVGNLGVDFTAAIWGGVPGVALAGGQLLVNGSLLAYSAYNQHQYIQGLHTSEAGAFNVANNAQDKVSQIQAQRQKLGCK